jgi:hypothetical protein
VWSNQAHYSIFPDPKISVALFMPCQQLVQTLAVTVKYGYLTAVALGECHSLHMELSFVTNARNKHYVWETEVDLEYL